MGEASKVAVLKVAAGPRWPGFSRAGGSLLCAHLLEMVAFVLVGAASAFFLPVPSWAKITMLVGLPLASGGLVLVSLLHHRVGHRLPEGVGSFLAGAAAPKRIMLRAGLILVVTWVARWFGVLFLLHAVGVHAGVGAALLYMVVTGLANTMPFLPGNVGLYQGAALGALAMAGHGGTTAAAASVFTPAAGSLATALLTGRFHLEGFQSPRHMMRSGGGAALMGTGGVMAFGCSIGQGLTGFSTLALASLIAFAGILVGTAAGLRGALRVRPLAAA